MSLSPELEKELLRIHDGPIYSLEQALRAAMVAALKAAEAECRKIDDEAWHAFKTSTGEARGNPYVQGESDGAEACAAAIRRLYTP